MSGSNTKTLKAIEKFGYSPRGAVLAIARKSTAQLFAQLDSAFLVEFRQKRFTVEDVLECWGRLLRDHLETKQVWVLSVLPSFSKNIGLDTKPRPHQLQPDGPAGPVVADVVFPFRDAAARTRWQGLHMAELAADKTLIIVPVPVYVKGERRPVLSEFWFVLRFNPLKSHAQVCGHLVHHAADFAANVIPSCLDYEAYRRVHRLLAVPGFQKQSADNYLAYALLKEFTKAFGDWVTLSFWRVSRSEVVIEKLAELRADAVPPTFPDNCRVDSFLRLLQTQPEQPASPRLLGVRLGNQSAEDVKNVIRMIQAAAPAEHKASTEPLLGHVGLVCRTPIITEATLVTPEPIPEEKLVHFQRMWHELTGKLDLSPGDSVYIVLFARLACEQQTTPDRRVEHDLTKCDKDEESPATQHAIPFFGAVVCHLKSNSVFPTKFAHAQLLLERAIFSLDGFSHQRLRFSIFARGIGLLADADTTTKIYDACEFLCHNLFAGCAVIDWPKAPGSNAPVYTSATLALCDLRAKEVELRYDRFRPDFFNCTAPEFPWQKKLFDHFKELALHAERNNPATTHHPPTARKHGLTEAFSAFVLPLSLESQTRFLFLIRNRASRWRSIEITFCHALSYLIARAFNRVSESRKGPSKSSEQQPKYLSKYVRQDLPLAKVADEVCTALTSLKHADSVLLFHWDLNAKVLTLLKEHNASAEVQRKGQLLDFSRKSLATLCLQEEEVLIGRSRGSKLLVSRPRLAPQGRSPKITVPFLGWVPSPYLVVACPIHAQAGSLYGVAIVSCKNRLERSIVLSLKRQVSDVCSTAGTLLIQGVNKLSLQVRDTTQKEMRSLFAVEHEPFLLSKPTTRQLPPELEQVYPEMFRQNMQRLLGQYVTQFGWLSATVRVADWFGKQLHLLAFGGSASDKQAYPLYSCDSVVAYCYTHASQRDVISLPQVLPTGGQVFLPASYPGLAYFQARGGTRSELCFPLRDNAGQCVGTLNLESPEYNGFANYISVCFRLRDNLENVLNMRSQTHRVGLAAALDNSRLFLAHAYHELKNEIGQLSTEIDNFTKHASFDRKSRDPLLALVERERTRVIARMGRLSDIGHTAMIDVAACLRHVSEEFSAMLKSMHQAFPIAFHVDLPAEPVKIRTNSNLFQHAIYSILLDIAGFLKRNAPPAPRLYNILLKLDSTGQQGTVQALIGHDGPPIQRDLAEDLFWYSVKSQAGGGVGLAFAGMQFRFLDMYPAARSSSPTTSPAAFANAKTWFVVYMKLVTV